MSDGTFSRGLTPSTTTRVVAAIRGLLGLGWPVWVLLAFGALAIFGPAAAPHNPDMFNVLDSLKAPSLSHPLGTDEFGRDVLSRMMIGARTLVTVSVVATIGTVVLGVLWGLTAAYLGGIREEFLMRTVDITVAVPELLIAIVIVSALGTSAFWLIVAVVIVFAPYVSRIVRSAALAAISQEYVDAAKIAGERTPYILFREILPNILPVVLVEAALRFGFVVLLVASLGFLGLGVQPPTPDWGSSVKESIPYMQQAPWLVLCPAVAIATIVLATHSLADRISSRRARRSPAAGSAGLQGPSLVEEALELELRAAEPLDGRS